MRTCSLQDFMAELEPWLDSDHIRSAELDQHGHLILHFLDGMKNVYEISDCNRQQIGEVLSNLRQRGIPVQE
ncbi:MAG TPA: hypothetical protein ENN98_06410 [Desulfurivibrio alkaliphilus]|uniref:Uncharacterized protein n=1 Tax=Desulfurivibrio alkaliphilus TaxID=427923 RepID=A0A7C2XGL9_9BACT|nr:hypothetical protein [Desulfurivibrio alkaliphilus]